MSNSTMRIAILSDVHGNIAALEAVLADVAGRGVERIVNLGNILSGPLFMVAYDWEKAARTAEARGRADWARALRTGFAA